jgi:transposase
MNEDLFARLSRRYLALDIHKHYSVVAGVNFEGQVILEPVRIEHADLEGWLAKNILVANPIKVKQIAQARVKTDIRDTLILARLLAANMIPEVWVPPVQVRNLRYLLSQRRHLVGMHTQTVNRMHSVAHRHHLSHARGKRFNEKNTKWQGDDELSDSEKFQLELDMSTKKHLAEQVEKITKKLAV